MHYLKASHTGSLLAFTGDAGVVTSREEKDDHTICGDSSCDVSWMHSS